MDKTNKPAPSTNTEKRELPPVADLFKQAWNVLVSQCKRLLFLWLYSVAAYIITALTCIVLIGGYLLVRISSVGIPLSQAPQIVTALTQPVMLIPIIIVASLFVIIITVIGLVYSSSVILTLADEQKSKSPWIHFRSSLIYAWPLFFTGLIVGFLAVGGLFFFLIPYLVIMTALCFYTYTVVLEKKRGVAAIQLSASMVMQNFLGIFVRLLLLWVAYIALSGAIAALFSKNGEGESMAGLLQFIGSIFLNLYSMVYIYVLYKQARAAYVEKPVSIAWMWIVAILGWFIFGALGIFGYRSFQAERRKAIERQQNYDKQMEELQNNMKEEEQKYLQDQFKESPFRPISPPKPPVNI